ncbi:3-hydroxyacyl-CoA dehydrogenase [Parasphingopyxis algicola]|uniref:3-hydroxyacyl-CoA dehydrogenase n=1 Tax=Parasphingopyxis algicola TaxID=2026624 RepID=UPI0015A295BB|nr:3-hydroxyacyl-CoA dehydrogenase [Parasphingopyxis algicola]QLC26360.1 3-hydroxyacyl-CoA dehydrogenase [Parasphingopyxis algicola]
MKQAENFQTVAVIGSGLIGIGWATVFCRAGLHVRMFDQEPQRLDHAVASIGANLEMMRDNGLVEGTQCATDRVELCDSIAEVVDGVDYVQESVFETIEAKRTVARQIDEVTSADILVGSSSSGIPASQITEDLTNRSRFLVVHPVNPPHLIPVVEIVPAPWSDPEAIPVIRDFMERIGQKPVVVRREIEGFILNRLQGALLNEAWALFADGYATAADIDRTVSDGLGLRWSFMGPFETIDLNAPGGIADYAERLSELYFRVAQSRSDPKPWPSEAVKRAESELRDTGYTGSIAERSLDRDRKLMSLLRHKRKSASHSRNKSSQSGR